MKSRRIKVFAVAAAMLLCLGALAFRNRNRGDLPELQPYAASQDINYEVGFSSALKVSIIRLRGIPFEQARQKLAHLKNEGYKLSYHKTSPQSGSIEQAFFKPSSVGRRIMLVHNAPKGETKAFVYQEVSLNDPMLKWTEVFYPDQVRVVKGLVSRPPARSGASTK